MIIIINTKGQKTGTRKKLNFENEKNDERIVLNVSCLRVKKNVPFHWS